MVLAQFLEIRVIERWRHFKKSGEYRILQKKLALVKIIENIRKLNSKTKQNFQCDMTDWQAQGMIDFLADCWRVRPYVSITATPEPSLAHLAYLSVHF